MEGYSTIEQVATHYQVSVSTVRAWIRRGLIPYMKIGGVYRMKISELDAAFKKRAEENPPPTPVEVQVTEVVKPDEAPVVTADEDL
jgi:excisionase family DNA binding protein